MNDKSTYIYPRGCSKSTIEIIRMLAVTYNIPYEVAAKCYFEAMSSLSDEEPKDEEVHRSVDSENDKDSKSISFDYFVCSTSGNPS